MFIPLFTEFYTSQVQVVGNGISEPSTLVVWKEQLLWSYLSPINQCKNSTVKFESETHGLCLSQSFGTSQLMGIVLSACDEVEVATLAWPVVVSSTFLFLPLITWGNDPIWLILNHQLAFFFGSPEKKEVHSGKQT